VNDCGFFNDPATAGRLVTRMTKEGYTDFPDLRTKQAKRTERGPRSCVMPELSGQRILRSTTSVNAKSRQLSGRIPKISTTDPHPEIQREKNTRYAGRSIQQVHRSLEAFYWFHSVTPSRSCIHKKHRRRTSFFTLNEFAEVGTRALSPGVMIPSPRCQCIDWLSERL